MDGLDKEQLRKHWHAVNRDVDEAIAIVETVRVPLFDRDYLKRFEQSFSAHCLDVVRHGLHKAGVMCIGRLWDDDNDALSVHNLLKLLRKSAVIDAIIARRRANMLGLVSGVEAKKGVLEAPVRAALESMQLRDAQRVETDTKAELERVQALAADAEFTCLRRSVINWRNKAIAHPVEKTRLEKTGVQVDSMKWGTLEKSVEKTTEIATIAISLADDLSVDFNANHRIWQTYASAFWSSFKERAE